ncbi:hypothetical protein V490_01130, partial [Pseudogymnoascus sp. VKM F-3557]
IKAPPSAVLCGIPLRRNKIMDPFGLRLVPVQRGLDARVLRVRGADCRDPQPDRGGNGDDEGEDAGYGGCDGEGGVVGVGHGT